MSDFSWAGLDLFDNPTSAYENGDEIGIFIDKSRGVSNKSIAYQSEKDWDTFDVSSLFAYLRVFLDYALKFTFSLRAAFYFLSPLRHSRIFTATNEPKP